MLQRHINVLAELVVGGNGVEQPMGYLVWIHIQYPNPAGVFERRQPFEQKRQSILEPVVLAEAGGILADQVDLPDALLKEVAGLGHDTLEVAAAKLPPVLRDHAKTARMVASFGDLDISHMPRRGPHPRREVGIEIWFG